MDRRHKRGGEWKWGSDAMWRVRVRESESEGGESEGEVRVRIT